MNDKPPLMNVAVDISIFTVYDGVLRVLLIKRGHPPYQDMWALPGGFMESETAAEAAYRELHEETGIPRDRVHLAPVGTYTEPDRDPRGRVVSISYMALIPSMPPTAAGGDAADTRWLPVNDALDGGVPLAFDHRTLIADSLEQARAQLEHTTIASAFCSEEFTVSDLRRVYESVWGVVLDVGNFHRKITKTEGFLVPAGRKTTRDGGRPANLYAAGDVARLQPPMYRPGG